MLTREMRYDRQLAIDVFGPDVLSDLCGCGSPTWGWGLGIGVRLGRAGARHPLLTRLLTARVAPRSARLAFVRSLIRFGLSFQASWYTFVGREQGINLVVGVIGGITSLGSGRSRTGSSPCRRSPSTRSTSSGFPAMSNLLARGEDAAPIILRTVRRAAIVATLIFPVVRRNRRPLSFRSCSATPGRDAAEHRAVHLPLDARPRFDRSRVDELPRRRRSARHRGVGVGVTRRRLDRRDGLLLPRVGVDGDRNRQSRWRSRRGVVLDRATHRAAGVAPYRPLIRPLVVAISAGAAGCSSASWTGRPVDRVLAAGVMTLALIAVLGLMAHLPERPQRHGLASPLSTVASAFHAVRLPDRPRPVAQRAARAPRPNRRRLRRWRRWREAPSGPALASAAHRDGGSVRSRSYGSYQRPRRSAQGATSRP